MSVKSQWETSPDLTDLKAVCHYLINIVDVRYEQYTCKGKDGFRTENSHNLNMYQECAREGVIHCVLTTLDRSKTRLVII